MKHTEQLQPRSPVQRVGTLTVQNKLDEKEKSGSKCCGGGSSDSRDTKK
jgi:hypothetical protein